MSERIRIYHPVYEAYRTLYKVTNDEKSKLKDYKKAVEEALEYLGAELDKEAK